MDRLTAIVLLLQDKPRTSDEIARQFEVSKRTILRDMQALSEIGVPVIAREGAGGGYSLPSGYLLTPLPLSSQEAFLLLLALRPLAQLGEVPFAQARASLLAKLQAVLPQQQMPDVEHLLRTVDAPLPAGTQRPRTAPFLEALIESAQSGRWLRVSYQSVEQLSTQHLLPRQISLRGGRWYCRAYAYERGEERTYRVDRVQALAPAEPGFDPGPVPAPRDYADPAHPEVVVTLTPRGAAAVETDPDLDSDLRPNGDGTLELRFRCPPGELDWYARYFAGLGADARVLEPDGLRARLAELGRKLVDEYQNR